MSLASDSLSSSSSSLQLFSSATDDSSVNELRRMSKSHDEQLQPITPDDLLCSPEVHLSSRLDDYIPLLLPIYTPSARAPFLTSDDVSFAQLFPSTHRLAIRHDDMTLDGNMNLRVETAATSPAVQLFHLRMHDLPDRDFSLRRYSRDSGRQVCSTKRAYAPTARNLPGEKRHSLFRRRRMSHGDGATVSAAAPTFLAPTTNMNLDFMNYARVQVFKKRDSCAFAWWGHRYEWRRVVDKDLGTVAFHLVRDEAHPVAHIVQEARSPSEVQAEQLAGGWVPPCSMWISEPEVLAALTDVAE